MDTYLKQATDFLTKTNTKLTIKFHKYDYHFTGDKEKRNIYRFKLQRGKNSYSGNFGDSINNTCNGVKPNEYDILTCLTKSDPCSFESFCDEYGYDPEYISSLKIYKAVCKEYQGMSRVFSDEDLEEMAEIQ